MSGRKSSDISVEKSTGHSGPSIASVIHQEAKAVCEAYCLLGYNTSFAETYKELVGFFRHHPADFQEMYQSGGFLHQKARRTGRKAHLRRN